MENMKCSEGKLPALSNLKFRIISQEQSERLQKVLFGLGYGWSFYNTHTQYMTSRFLFVEDNTRITFSNDNAYFQQNNKFIEVDTEAFIAQHSPPVLAEDKPIASVTIDKHYSFVYKLTEDDIKKGSIKIDPYFVSYEWQLGDKDNTGVIFHCLKTLARFGVKNSKEREITALYKQIMRLAELEGITLG